MSRRGFLVMGAMVLAARGQFLAFAADAGVAPGTICGLAGLGLVAWSALRRGSWQA